MLQTMFLLNREELAEAKKKILECKTKDDREDNLYEYLNSLTFALRLHSSSSEQYEEYSIDESQYIYPKGLIKILKHCLNNDSNERPSFSVLLIMILEVKNKRTPTVKEMHDTGINNSFDVEMKPKDSIFMKEDESIEVFNVSKDSNCNISCVPVTIEYSSK